MHDKVRYQLFLDRPLSERLEALAAKPGVTKSSVLVQALEAWLDRQARSELENRFNLRLNRIAAALARIERADEILLESLALFVRYELSIHAPLAENDHSGRALGRERFEAFVRQVGRAVGAGRHTLGDPAGGEQ